MSEKSTSAISAPRLVKTARQARAALTAARAAGKRIGLAPTMGALHEGHLSLVRASLAECDFTAVSIFVNPTQFGPQEDLQQYPRDLAADLEALGRLGVDLVFAPEVDEIYPDGFSTYVEPPQVAHTLEGACRPGHFRGVVTVVLKLFNMLPADVAFFGHKDYQQSLVIRRMAADFNLPIEIRVCPTVREADGLALSSRNVYLSADQRGCALSISASLRLAEKLIGQGEHDAEQIRRQMRQTLDEAGLTKIDYVALADPDTLQESDRIDGPVVALIAAFVGQTRLIDNLRIG